MSVTSSNTRGKGDHKRASIQDVETQSGGFLLNTGVVPENGPRAMGKRKAADGESAASGSTGKRSVSQVSSKRKSRVSPRQSYDLPSTTNAALPYERAGLEGAAPAIDAEQIVRMALSLSESRRLNLAPGHLPSSGTPSPRRTTYSSSPLSNSSLFAGQEAGSLRYQLQQQRRTSRNISPSPVGNTADIGGQHISPATIARAEKARKYIELSTEYKRLLEVLPPLKPNLTAHQDSGSFMLKTHEQSGNSITHVRGDSGQHDRLGRTYNPLQYIRNRKIRLRERQVLDGEAEGWDDIPRVVAWIGSVEDKADHPGFRLDNVAMLPEWVEPVHDASVQDPLLQTSANTLKVKPQASKIRPKYDWLIKPADLLADAYWMEQGEHKGLVEDHRGRKVFPNFHRPAEPQSRIESPQATYETQDILEQEDIDYPESAFLNGSGLRPLPKEYDAKQLAPPRAKGKVSRATRTLLRRPRRTSVSSSNFSVSDTEDAVPSYAGRRTLRSSVDNIGPLEKHMRQIMEAESRNHSDDAINRSSSDHWDRNALLNRSNRLSGEHNAQENRDRYRPNRTSVSGESAFSRSQPGTPRISVEFYGDGDRDINKVNLDTSKRKETTSPANHRDSPPFGKAKPHRLDFLRRGKTKEKNQIEENDFAPGSEKSIKESETLDQTTNFNRRLHSYDKHSTSDTSKLSFAHARAHSKDINTEATELEPINSKSEQSNSRLFKVGRIGELVREEKPGLGDFIWKRRAPYDDSRSSSGSRKRFHSSDDDGANFAPDDARGTDEINTNNRLLARERRSQSASDLKETKYHFNNLPEFRSSSNAGANEHLKPEIPVNKDSIGRRRLNQVDSRQSRFDRLDPSALDSSDISPHTSTLDLTRENTATTSSLAPVDHVRTYGFPTASNTSSRSESRVRSSGNRLNQLLSVPGGVGKGGLPKTGLTSVDMRRNAMSRPYMGGLRSWSIADGNIAMVVQQPTSVTGRELEYVRAMLMSSGVKASNMVKRANQPRDKVPKFLLKASETSGLPLPEKPVSRKQEHILAARLLSKNLESSISDFEVAAKRFREQTCSNLHKRIDDLRYNANSKLTPKVRSCGDDADAFIGRLTTTHTISITRVNDSIDLMMRSRRRRLRLLSRIGFTFLEWVLVGIMWAIWLIVMFFHIVKNLVLSSFRITQWLLWL